MTMYLHLDRMGQLKSGDIVQPLPHPRSIGVLPYPQIFCDGFVEHLESLAKQGLSWHGVSYLVKSFQDPSRINLFLNELYLEHVRWGENIQAPSRLQSFFAWDTYEQALKFAKLNKTYPKICEVEALGNVFKADMNLSRRGGCVDSALKYWNGEMLDNSPSYNPVFENLLELPVRVIRVLEVNP